MSKERISDVRPSIREHAFVAGPALAGSTTPVVISPAENIILSASGSPIAPGSLSDYKTLTLKVTNSGWDDSFYGNMRLTLINHPRLAGLVFNASAVLNQVGLAAANTNITTNAAVRLGARYQDSLTAPLEGGGSLFVPADDDIDAILLQIATSASTPDYDTELRPEANPVLYIDLPREPTSARLPLDLRSADLENGPLMVYSSVKLYAIDNDAAGNPAATLLSTIKTDSFDIDVSSETVTWEEGKPSIIYHEAVSKLNATCKFQLDQVFPYMEALAMDTAATDNDTDDTVDITRDARPRPTITKAFLVEWRTMGGHFVREYFPKGKLSMSGSKSFSGDFTGAEFTLTGHGDGVDGVNSICSYTRVAYERIQRAIQFAIVTP